MITLEKLNKSNWEACSKLELAEEQKGNLPSNIVSIAELNFFPNTTAVAIKNDDEIVGFGTFGIPEGEKVGKIFRLMIDKRHQKKGFGKMALIEMIKTLFDEHKLDTVEVCYHPKSEILKRFYASVGFEEKEILPAKMRPEGKMLAILKKENFKL